MRLQKKDKIQIVITAGLAVVLVLIVVANFKSAKPVRQAPSFSQQETKFFKDQIAAEGQQDNRLLYKRLEEQTKDLELTRDPFFKVPASADPETRGLNLSGISWDEGEPLAIINDQIVAAGDTIEGNTIVEIKQYRVTVDDGSETFELKLNISAEQ